MTTYADTAKMAIALPSESRALRKPTNVGNRAPTPRPRLLREALPRATQAAGKQLGEERADRAEGAGSEEPERKAQRQHHDSVADAQIGIGRDDQGTAGGEQNQGLLASDAVGKMRPGQVAAEGSGNDDDHVRARIEDRKMPHGLQIRWQPRCDRVIAALDAHPQYRCQQSDLQYRRRKDLEEMRFVASGGEILARSGVNLRLGNVAPNVEDQQRRQDANPEHGAPSEACGKP